MKTCKCPMSIKLLGDGCEVCNPDLTAEITKDNMIEALAEQNRLLCSSLNLLYSWANNWDSEFMNAPEWRNQDYPIMQAAVALPDLSTSILNRRDARTLREAANEIDYGSMKDASEQLYEMAAEKEKA